MLGGRSQPRFAAWRMEAHPQVVEYAEEVLASILAAVEEGFQKFPYGGLAVGGVLFGKGDRHLVRILGVRTIPCDHSAGPSFTLSGGDYERLAFLLKNYQGDPELSELIPVGWYHSHTRSGLLLTPSDLELHERHFREPWQIALVIRPEVGQPAKAAIFVRGDTGEMPTEPALLIEALPARGAAGAPKPERPPAAAPPAEREAPPESARPPVPEEPSAQSETVPVEEVDLFASFGGASGRERSPGRKWLLRVALMIVLAAGLWAAGRTVVPEEYWATVRVFSSSARAYLRHTMAYWKNFASSAAEPKLALRTMVSGNELTVRWDSSSRVLTGVTRGLLEIRDGAVGTRKELSVTDLFEGSYSYRRLSADVQVRLTVYRGDGMQYSERTRFLGRTSGLAPAERAQAETPAELRAEVERLRTAIARQSDQARIFQDSLAALRQLERSRQEATAKVPAPPRRTAAAPAKRPAVPARTMPVIKQKPPVVVQQPAVTLEQSAPAAAVPAAPSPAAVTATARSGKLIWTGFLPAGETLTLATDGPSRGTASGTLPGAPIRISVFPGEMTGAGLTVYSSDNRYATQPRVEPPGPNNSWIRTTYRYDEEQARSITIVEQPGAANGWRQLTVRAENRPLSVLVIEWSRTE